MEKYQKIKAALNFVDFYDFPHEITQTRYAQTWVILRSANLEILPKFHEANP
jgi:hypothetical protein